MSFHEVSCDNDHFSLEEHLEGSQCMEDRPFRYFGDDSSEDLVESEMQENPFKECQRSSMKDKRLVFQSKNVAAHVESWSEKMYRLIKMPRIVRSAPEPRDNHWTEFNNGEIHTLPVIGQGRSDAIKRVSAETVVALLTGKIKRDFKIVDARYKYEYQGGHIINAVSIPDGDINGLLKDPKLIIFHCEYSSIRGPSLAQKLRDADRKENIYPKLTIPEIYVMEGGYKDFYKQYPEFCTPRSYVSMHDKKYALECSIEHNKKKQKINKL